MDVKVLKGILAREALWMLGCVAAAGSPFLVYQLYLMVSYGDLNFFRLFRWGFLRFWLFWGLTAGPVLYVVSGVVRSTVWEARNLRT